MTLDEKKRYLRSYRVAWNASQDAMARLKEFRERNDGLKAIVMDDMPHGHNPRDLSDYVAELDHLEREMTAKIWEYIDACKDVQRAIDKSPNDYHKRLLRMIYLDFMSFEAIAVKTGYSYRQVVRMHRRAVEELEI